MPVDLADKMLQPLVLVPQQPTIVIVNNVISCYFNYSYLCMFN